MNKELRQVKDKVNKLDYYAKVKVPYILKDGTCPRCDSDLGAIPPDTVWCTNNKCSYARLYLVGNGVMDLEFKPIKK